MTRVAASHLDEVDFLYVLGQHGWSDIFLYADRRMHTFRITHIFSDPIADLIQLCKLILEGEDAAVRFPDEPGATYVEVTKNRTQNHLLQFKLSECDDWDNVPGKCKEIVSFEIKASQLLVLIVTQLQKVQSLCREPSYEKKRTSFPHREFEDLMECWQKSAFRK